MIFFTEGDIDRLIEEDIPYGDLTSFALSIAKMKGRISFAPRGDIVVCCTEEVERILSRFNIKAIFSLPSGTAVEDKKVFLEAEGYAEDIHKAWRICLNLLEYSSGIATRTKAFVDAALEINPDIIVVTTRKSLPGVRKIAMKGIICGGALPHRLGLSETVLIFKEHMRFVGGIEGFVARLPKLNHRLAENKIAVEVQSEKDALRMAEAGVDILQLDKLDVIEIARIVKTVKAMAPRILVAAAGGINEGNIRDYASTGADIIVTSSLYFGRPSDISAEIMPS
ncbi:MAG TPA: ModD protein [Dissulfurispiraceae bacterium]|nr:ModD protein [Dissulfurispiraceae bacterium]